MTCPGGPLMTHDPLAIPSRIYVIGEQRAFDEIAAIADGRADTRHFSTFGSFLAAAPHLQCGAVVFAPSDTSTPLAGLTDILARRAVAFVLVALSRQDVALAVTAIRMGACDVIVRPCRLDDLRRAQSRQVSIPPASPVGLAALETLSDREREVFDAILGGMTNKQIGSSLGISHRTVEIHRGRVMRKLGVSRFSELLEIGFALRAQAPHGVPGDTPAPVLDDAPAP